MSKVKKEIAISEIEPEKKERKIKQISQLEHVKMKSMWIGSKEKQSAELYVLENNKFILQKMEFTPGLNKIFDEVLTNATDHYANFPKLVKNIKIKFNMTNGEIDIYNDGPSMGIYKTKNLKDEEMYAPQMIASEFQTGDNFDDNDARTTSGTNGAGLKLANAFSEYLEVETVDVKRGLYYKQRFQERLTVINKPIVKKLKDMNIKSTNGKIPTPRDFTRITFMPSYHALGYKGQDPSGFDIEMAETLNKLFEARAYQSAAYIDASVYYNGKKIDIVSQSLGDDDKDDKDEKEDASENILTKFETYANMYLPNPEYGLWYSEMPITYNIPNSDKTKKFKWEVAIGISDGKFRQVSLINAINVYNGGNHIKNIQKKIIDALKPKIEKELNKAKVKFNANLVLNTLFIFVKGAIINPEFTSQIKDAIDDPVEKFDTLKFKPKDWDAIWNLLEPHVMSQFLNKFKDKKNNRITRGEVVVSHGQDAKKAGSKKHAMDTTLIICEGDSAMTLVRGGINDKKSILDYEYYGLFSIQGVPINARRECKESLDKKNNTVLFIRSQKLQDNIRLTALVKLLGLDYTKTYDPNTKEGRDEFNTLRYGRIIAAVDADVDGMGQIFGLLTNFFILFWPNLAKWGFIRRFNTPIIRAYPKSGKEFVKEFYTAAQYDQWIGDEFKGDNDVLSRKYNVKYYKGLASHNKKEIPQLFKNFEDKLSNYVLDDEANLNMIKYYGKETEERKKLLATPLDIYEDKSEDIDISVLLHTNVKEFQRDNIIRKLPHLMDGMVPSRRKAFYAARVVFGTTKATNKEMKVNAFVNDTSKRTHYHHGEDSLAQTIIKMAQEFPGARKFPMLRPEGQFGSRRAGGKDAGSPRYIYTKLNQRLCYAMFPKEDDFLLEYQFDDSDRCEPTYFVPILPMAILESMTLPATGWATTIWARDIWDVISNVRNMISGKITKCDKLKICLRDYKGKIKVVDKKIYSVGVCKYNKTDNTIVVSELPLKVFSMDYTGDYADPKGKAFCQKPEFSASPLDETSDEQVKITFYLQDNAMESILEKYKGDAVCSPLEEFMKLKQVITSNLNMIDNQGNVVEFKKYSEVVDQWFWIRKTLYTKRIDRMVIIKKLMIKYLKNIIRYAKNHHSYGISPKTKRDKVDEILRDNKYDTFNHTLLESPKYTEVDQLESLIINNPKNGTSYNYIMNLRYGDLIEESCIQRVKKLEEEEAKLAALLDDCDESDGHFKGQKTWLSELDILESAITDGLKLGWDYGEDKANFE